MKNLINVAIASLAFAASCASATVLTAKTHIDNGYKMYISTSDSTAGTLIGEGENWYQLYTDTTVLAAGQDYYLHIYAYDQGGIAAVLGQFSLDSTDHKFANGTQTLLTNTTDWMGNNTGFGNTYTGLTDLAQNGSGVWSFWSTSDVNGSARWIWAGDANDQDAAYLSTKISAADVPEPASLALLALGAAGMGAIRRRKQAK